MSVTLASGKRVTFEEVVKVALLKHKIVLDAASLAQIQSKVTQSKGTSTSTTPSTEEKTVSSVDIVRAGLFCRLVSLFQGFSNVRANVIQTIADLLNGEFTPCLGNTNYGTNLAAILSGSGFCLNNASNAVVSSKDILTPIVLTNNEVEALTFPFMEIGTGCLLAGAAQNLLKTLDCLSSLSCEAIGVNVAAFDATNFEQKHEQRGQMNSAANLRLLLEGSKGVNKEKCDVNKALQFRELPQINGPAVDNINAACKSLEIELNSCEATATDILVYSSTQTLLAVKNIVNAVNELLEASTDRATIINKLIDSDAVITAKQAGESDSLLVSYFQKVNSLSASLANEVFAALTLLNVSNAAADVTNKTTKLSVADEDDAESKQARGSKPVEDDSKYTPEQLAKIQAKRKEKEEKAAAKAAAKAAKKAGDVGVVLGAGAAQIRGYINTHGKVEDTLSLEKVNQLLYPFNYGEDSVFTFCAKVMEQLNSSGVARKPKIPKGTRDYVPDQMKIREQAFNTIRRIFKRHVGVEIDTPVFELKEILTGKYGEDSKLIYDLADQGGELLSLRYDLTVPFARFLAMNSVGNIKRYHIAKVYRRDQPQLNRGRYREFYQCDIDIAGSYSPMVPDAEIITVCHEILSELPVGPFLIKLNHRKILDSIFDLCGVPMEKFRPICSAVDKLDKLSWEEVKAEMVEEKGLTPEVADRIGTFVLNTGKPFEMWNQLMDRKIFGEHVEANKAMAELKLLFTYLEAMGSLESVSFDLSLARGLDYYTGVIYEAVLTDGTSQVGSIAAGGRYDNLVGMFSPAGVQTPCVGVSIGVERVFTIMEKKAAASNVMQSSTVQVFIATIGDGLITERMKIAKLLWAADFVAEYSHLDNPKLVKQMDDVLERNIPFMIVFGKDEIKNGLVQVKDMRNKTEMKVAPADLVSTLLGLGCIPLTAASDKHLLEEMKKV